MMMVAFVVKVALVSPSLPQLTLTTLLWSRDVLSMIVVFLLSLSLSVADHGLCPSLRIMAFAAKGCSPWEYLEVRDGSAKAIVEERVAVEVQGRSTSHMTCASFCIKTSPYALVYILNVYSMLRV